MSRYRNENPDCKVYVGDLSSHASKQDVEDAFSYYGPIRNVWVARNPPGFAFVEFEDVRDAEDAVKEVDGRRTVCGRRVRVERAGGKRGGGSGYRRPFRGGSSSRRGRPFHPEDRCYECGDKGHYARDCRGHKRDGRRSRGRGGRSYSRSRSRSVSRDRRTRSRDRHSRSRDRHSRSHSSSRSRSLSRTRNNRKSRSRSASRNNDRSFRRDKSASHGKSVSNSRSKSHSPKTKREQREVNGDA
ncbi:hypothetical protein PGB90_009782 [Kerria lacca]